MTRLNDFVRKAAKSAWLYWSVLMGIIVALTAWQLSNLGGQDWLYDEAGYVAVPWMVRAGHPLYTEVFSPSPPLFTLSLVGAYALGGESVEVARATIVLYSALGLLAAALVAREIAQGMEGRTAGKWAALATTLFLFLSPEYFRLSRLTMSEVPAISLALLSVVAALRYWRSGRRCKSSLLWLALSGLALAASLLIKLVALFALPLPVLVVFLRHSFAVLRPAAGEEQGEERGNLKDVALDLGLLGVAFGLPILLALCVYDPQAMYEQAVALHWQGRSYHPIDMVRRGPRIVEYLWQDRGLAFLALYGGLWCGWKRSRPALPLLVWLVLALLVIINQAPLTTHHMLPLLPPMAILGGVGLVQTVKSLSEVPGTSKVPGTFRTLWGLIGAGLVAFYLLNLPGVIGQDAHQVLETHTPDELEEDAMTLLTIITRPGDVVVSDDPLIVLLAGRNIVPALTSVDWRRLGTGQLAEEQLITMTEASEAAALVFWKERFDSLPNYKAWVEERYGAIAGMPWHRVYLPGGVPPQWVLGDGIELLGSRLAERHLAAEGRLRVTLFWRAVRRPQGDYHVHLKLTNAASHVWGEQQGRPRYGGRPTNGWQPGQMIWDPRWIEVLPGTPPGVYNVEVDLYDPYAGRALDPVEGGALILGEVEIPPCTPPAVEELDIEQVPGPWADLGGKARLLGYKLESGSRPGDGIHLTLFWQALERMEENYTVFTHLVDAEGKMWGQKDNQPVDGFYPTTAWQEGEIVRDQYDILITPEAPPGHYALEIGMYLAETGERLPVFEEGRPPADKVFLAVEVKE